MFTHIEGEYLVRDCKIVEHEVRSFVCKGEESLHLTSQATENVLPSRPPEDQKAQDKLKGNAPEDVPPNHLPGRGGEDEAEEEEDEDSRDGLESLPVVLGVDGKKSDQSYNEEQEKS